MAILRKKKKTWLRKETIWTLFIIFIMTSSIVGYLWIGGDASADLEYNGHTFRIAAKNGVNYYVTKVSGKEYQFFTNPYDVLDIRGAENVSDLITKSTLVKMTSNASDLNQEAIAVAQYSLNIFLDKNYKIATTAGFNGENPYDYTIITCQDATEQALVIEFATGNETKVETSGNCISITGISGYDFVRISDRIQYGLAGIVK